ncbi:MAG: type II secretion system protein GspN [Spirochaetota bacterium]
MVEKDDLAELEESELGTEEEHTFEEDSIESKFSIKQKLFAWIGGFISFIAFIIIVFPYEEVTRYFVAKMTVPKNILVDFRSLNFSFWGDKTVDVLKVQTPDGMSVKVEEVIVSASLLELLQKNVKGETIAKILSLETENYEFKVSNLNIKHDLNKVDTGLMKLNGNMKINFVGGKILKTPEYALLGSLGNTKIKSILVNLAFRNGTLEIQKLKLRSDKVKVDIKGLIKLNQNFSYSNLSLDLCPELTKKYANERPDLADTLQLFKNLKKSSCFKVKGTVSSPKVDTPNFSEMNKPSLPEQPPSNTPQPQPSQNPPANPSNTPAKPKTPPVVKKVNKPEAEEEKEED